MESSQHMQRPLLIVRIFPVMMLIIGTLNIADWIYVGYAEPLKLLNGLGFILMGVAHMADNHLAASNPNSPVRKAALALLVLGFLMSGWVVAQRWL